MKIAKPRRTIKTWTYNQITKATEQRIKACMANAREHDDDQFVQRLYRGWAFGAYLVWRDLTMGWQKDGDDDRMKALAEHEPPE